MDTMARTEPLVAVVRDPDRAWARTGRIAGYLAAVGFLVTTVLFLVEAANLLGTPPEFVQTTRTSAGLLPDEARFWAATFAYQHRILWDVFARDLIGSAAFIALIVVGVALRHRAVGDRPAGQLMVTFLTVGGIVSVIANLLYLGNAEFWRLSWGPPPSGAETSFVAVGRATTAIDNLTEWPEAFGYLLLAAGVVCIASVVRREAGMPRWLPALCWMTAAALVAFALSIAFQADGSRQIAALAVGAVLAPWVCVWLGRVLGSEAVVSTG
jgi:hypothetical protein